MRSRIKVLVVDDSAIVRQTLESILNEDPDIQVIATAADPYIAAQKMKTIVPDVITLDVEMPRMDGITFLKKIMTQHPLPVVMCSSLTEAGCDTTLKALEYGAVEIITKPRMGARQHIIESRIKICEAVKAAANVRSLKKLEKSSIKPPPKKLTADAILSLPNNQAMLATTEKVVAIGASTGGTEALTHLLRQMPKDSPGIAIVQHMPEMFTASFAKRLNELCDIQVKEAENNDSVLPGRALIAPGNKHMILKRSGARYYVDVREGPLVCRHRPSVDVLFRSTARYAGSNAIAALLTGMGDDGAKGMRELKESNAYTIAQDEKTCVVFGMPKEAIKLGAVEKVLPLEDIALEIYRQSKIQ